MSQEDVQKKHANQDDILKKQIKEFFNTLTNKSLRHAVLKELTEYCGYRGQYSFENETVNPFDDPFVGAALLTNDGTLLACHRKRTQHEPHAEVQTLLSALSSSKSEQAHQLCSKIRTSIEEKIWFVSQERQASFLRDFSEAGQIVRKTSDLRAESEFVLISSLEPCRDFESQPGCAEVIAAFGVKQVWYGCDDTNEKGQGRGTLVGRGINVYPNCSVEHNLDVNALFYYGVHCLDLVTRGSVALAAMPLRYTSVRFGADKLQASFSAEEERLRIGYDPRVRPYRAQVDTALEKSQLNGVVALGSEVDRSRVLFLSTYNRAFLYRYFIEYQRATTKIPGTIVIYSSKASLQEQKMNFVQRLESAGVKIFHNSFRKQYERSIAMHQVLTWRDRFSDGYYYVIFKLQPNLESKPKPEGGLGSDSRAAQVNYRAYAGSRSTILTAIPVDLAKDDRILSIEVFWGAGAGGNVAALITDLHKKLGLRTAPIAQKVIVVASDDAERQASMEHVRKGLIRHGLNTVQVSSEVRHSRSEIGRLHTDHAAGRLDPAVIDLGSILQQARTWNERKIGGQLLASAASRDPGYFTTEILSRLKPPHVDKLSTEWRQLSILLIAIGHHKELTSYSTEVGAQLEAIAEAIDHWIEREPPMLPDIIVRFVSAVCSLHSQGISDVSTKMLNGKRFLSYIRKNLFLVEEFCYYTVRIPQSREQLWKIAFPIAQQALESLFDVLQEGLVRRIARLEVCFDVKVDLDQLVECITDNKVKIRLKETYTTELTRCRVILNEGLLSAIAGFNATDSQFGLLICSALFVRSHRSHSTQTNGIQRSLASNHEHWSDSDLSTVRLPWRGDRAPLARAILSEVANSHHYELLRVIAGDEDVSNRWAAIELSFDQEYWKWLLNKHQQRQANARQEISKIIDTALSAGRPQYWLYREFFSRYILLFEEGQTLPFTLRIEEIPSVHKLLQPIELLENDPLHEIALHPEVSELVDEFRRRHAIIFLLATSPEKATTTSLESSIERLRDRGHYIAEIFCAGPTMSEGWQTGNRPEFFRMATVIAVITSNASPESILNTLSTLTHWKLGIQTPPDVVLVVDRAVAVEQLQNSPWADVSMTWDYLCSEDQLHLVDTFRKSQIGGVVRRAELWKAPARQTRS